MKHNADNDIDVVKSDVYQKNVQQEEQEEENLQDYVENSKSVLKPVLKDKKSRTFVRSKHKATKNDSVECAPTAEGWQSDMVAIMRADC